MTRDQRLISYVQAVGRIHVRRHPAAHDAYLDNLFGRIENGQLRTDRAGWAHNAKLQRALEICRRRHQRWMTARGWPLLLKAGIRGH
jgi:hypothetical protein